MAGKVLAKIMVSRLASHIFESVLSESLCGFRRERGTTDIVFSLRQMQKCLEQDKGLVIVFVDLSTCNAFYTVPLEFLCKVLLNFEGPEKLLKVISLFHFGIGNKGYH